MRCICGAIPNLIGSRSGRITIDTNDIRNKDLKDVAQLVKYVPPDPSESILGLTVALDILSVSEDEDSARASLAVMGIEHLWDRETTSLSGGEQVRLVLAGVLSSKVPIILLDSPLEQLDMIGRAEFLQAIQTLYISRKCTIIVSDLDFDAFATLASRAILLEGGRIVHDCPINQLTTETRVQYGLKQMPDQFFQKPTYRNPECKQLLCSLENVSVRIEGTEILKNISLSVRSSECLVVLGPNGGGKSTAMLCLARALQPFEGKVIVSGRIGYVFQNTALQLLGITPRKELGIGPRFRGWSKERETAFIDESLTSIGLRGDEWCIDLHLSRVKFLEIKATDFDCDFLILDEPTLGLDYDDLHRLQILIREETAKGRGVVLITHNRNLAEIGDHAVLIREGRSIAWGTPKEILTLYEFEDRANKAIQIEH
jgi:energy-coupling factor transport system ATP-binding protein